jgi:hypothetical protein
LEQVEKENLAAAAAEDAAAQAAKTDTVAPHVESANTSTQTSKPETPKASGRRQARGQADSAPAASDALMGTPIRLDPNLRYDATRLIVRTLVKHGLGMGGWNSEAVETEEADFGIGQMFAQGWEPIKVRSLGYSAAGINMIWILGHVPSGAGKYTEARHITRIIGAGGMESDGVSGFKADDYINSFIAEGFEIAAVDAIGLGPEGLTMLWVLAR